MKSFTKKPSVFSLAGALALLLAATPAHTATLLVEGYSLSTYASGLPVENRITGMTINPATRQIFYMGEAVPTFLRRLNPNRTVTTLAAENSSLGFYPYNSTDIEYYSGNVLTCDAAGHLIKYSATAPAYGNPWTLSGFDIESGIAQVGGVLYLTSGVFGTSGILTFDPVSGNVDDPNLPAPPAASSLEYDAIHNRLIVASVNNGGADNGFYTIDLATKTLGPVFGAGFAFPGNFSVDPTGTFIYARWGDTLMQIDIAADVATPFANELEGNADSVFGPSSSGSGQSLYVGDGTAIREISGFLTVPEPPTFASLVFGAVAFFNFCRRRV